MISWRESLKIDILFLNIIKSAQIYNDTDGVLGFWGFGVLACCDLL